MEASIFRIPLPDDYEGSVAATLVRFAAGRAPSRAVLYLHGYVDYFFQTHMARWFVARGWSFYALDLRKYGRSLEAGQTPYYCRDLHEYYPEIDRSIERMRQDRIERIVLMGHSTGGLLASLYASDGRRRADIERLILYSPFFEFNASWFKRRVAVPVAAVLGRLWPYAHKKNELSPFYFDSVYRGARGEWDFDTQWKPRDGVPLYFIWLCAIRKAQRRLRRGLGLRIPVLVLSSADSCRAKTWNDCFRSADAVLNVADIRRYAGCLGSCVTSVTIEGGLHDLVLSAAPVREKVLETMTSWLDCPESRSDPSSGESSA